MKLADLFLKLPASKHQNIRVLGNVMLYDSGTTIYQAYIDEAGELIPATKATKDALAAL